MFGAACPLRRSKTQRLLLLSESRLVALRQIKAAGSGVQASPRPSRIKADPDHASDQKRTAKYGTDKIEVMTRAASQAPSHAGKHAEPFGHMGEHHDC